MQDQFPHRVRIRNQAASGQSFVHINQEFLQRRSKPGRSEIEETKLIRNALRFLIQRQHYSDTTSHLNYTNPTL